MNEQTAATAATEERLDDDTVDAADAADAADAVSPATKTPPAAHPEQSAGEEIASPRLRELATALETDPAASDAFWAEAAKRRVPMIEPHPDRADARLVTFLYRTATSHENIVLRHGFIRDDPASNKLHRLGETDVWFLTLAVRDDLRAGYLFSLDDPLTEITDYEDYKARAATWVADPFNPPSLESTLSPLKAEDQAIPESILTMPAAAAQPWFRPRPDVPAGTLTAHRVASQILGNERDVWLYLPAGADPAGDPLPLVVIFDGGWAKGSLAYPTTLDNLIADHLIPPMAAVLVDNVERHVELPCNPAFANFLADELLPWARQQHPITVDPARTIVTGLSYGGLASAYCALARPDAFGNVLSQSGSFWWKPDPRNAATSPIPGDAPGFGWLQGEYARLPRVSVRYYLDVGRLEYHEGPWHRGPSMIESNRWLRDVLIAKGYEVTYREFGAGHDPLGWRGTFADGLLDLSERIRRGRPA